jgi:hypothetical protein
MTSQAIWAFETKRFRVEFQALPEDMDPADSFEFPEDIAMVRRGDATWFCAAVVVYTRRNKREAWQELAADYLGGCAYHDVHEFYTSHRDADPMNRNCSLMRNAKGGNIVICHYFPGMVAEAIAEARRRLERKAA